MAVKISGARRNLIKEEKAKNSGGGVFYPTKKLTSDTIRLTPLGDGQPVARMAGDHYILGQSYVCPSVVEGKPCPACMAAAAVGAKLREKKDSEKLKKLAEALRLRRRFWMKVISRELAKGKGPMILAAPRGIYDPVFKEFDKNGIDLSDANEGFDIEITKSGTGFDTEYDATVSREESPLDESPKKMKEIIEAANAIDFDAFLQVNEKGLRAAVETLCEDVIDLGALNEDAFEEAEEEEPAEPVKKSKKAAPPADEDEEEEEGEEAEEEEEGDEEETEEEEEGEEEEEAGDDEEEGDDDEAEEEEESEEAEDGWSEEQTAAFLAVNGKTVIVPSEKSDEKYKVTGKGDEPGMVVIADAKGQEFDVGLHEIKVCVKKVAAPAGKAPVAGTKPSSAAKVSGKLAGALPKKK